MEARSKLSAAVLTLSILAAATLGAQQVTGDLGSPSATTTISGQQLPPPPPKFGGVIKESATDSKTWWPPRIVPPKGAPNVLLIMTDDQGYGVPGTFGGVIPTPALDRIAKNGLRYTQFHSTALCSPTRAALITGRNHHAVGFGVITELSTGYPGYDSIIGPDNATIGRILGGNGYATSWFGKNHNTPGFQYSLSGPFDQWPSGMGFQYFYGFMGGETDQWEPYLVQDHTQIFPWIGKPGYNLTTDLADEAIAHMQGLNAAAPDQPFFVYYVPGGSHSPHQPKKEWIEKFKGKFDKGWNVMREEIFANQKRLGVIPQNAKLTAWPKELPTWDSLSVLQKKLYARQAEVYAGYTAYTDYEIGRVIQAVEDMGKLDNTLIIYIDGDNGTSPEGTLSGTFNQYTAYNGILDVPEALQLLHLEDWGSVVDVPAHGGGLGLGVRYALQMDQAGGLALRRNAAGPGHFVARSHQGPGRHPYPVPPHHRHRAHDPRGHGHQGAREVDGIKQKPIEGVSMAYTFDAANAKAPSTRKTQYFELMSNRGIYHDGWYANTTPPVPPWVLNAKMPDVNDYKWELYNIAEDYSQADDLAPKNPAKLKEMQALFEEEAKKYQVFPLANSSFARAIEPRPSAIAGKTVFTYSGENPGIPFGNAPNILNKSFTITAEIEVPKGGGEGMIVTAGGRFGGFGLYILKGKPVFTYNLLDLKRTRWEGGVGSHDVMGDSLSAGKHTIVFDFTYDGPGIAKGGSGVLKVDGKVLATEKMEHTVPFILPADETFDVGVDLRTPVDDSYQVPFRFTGKIDKLTFKLGPSQLAQADQKKAAIAIAKASD